jgi:hypothetical protein
MNKDAVRSSSNMPQGIYRRPDSSAIPSHESETVNNCDRTSIMEQVIQGKINGKEADEIRRKANCLAPAYNKGAYQYIGDASAAEDAGRKK